MTKKVKLNFKEEQQETDMIVKRVIFVMAVISWIISGAFVVQDVQNYIAVRFFAGISLFFAVWWWNIK